MTKASKEPLISVIVPIYNVEKYLDRCIESIVNQTYKNLEIILVDDGSPDNSPKMCDDWAKKDRRIIVIHKENGGLSDARNAGIDIAKGEYIGFVDSDDWIDKNMYKILYTNLIKYEADLSCCEIIRVKNENHSNFRRYNNKIELYTQEEYMKIFFKINSQKTVYYAPSKLYKRRLIEKNLYPKGLTSEDVVGTFKVLLNCERIVSINYPYYYYFYNNDSITGGNFTKRDLDLFTIWDIVVNICKSSKKEYLKMAEFNRLRIDYTILMRMALQLKYDEIVEKYGDLKNELINNLRKNKSVLLKSSMPFSRKITLRMILINYKLFVSLCHLIRK